jgi:glucose-6-phosphate isomerase
MDATFSGEKIIVAEERTVLHKALRAAAGERCVVDGGNVVPGVEGGVKP